MAYKGEARIKHVHYRPSKNSWRVVLTLSCDAKIQIFASHPQADLARSAEAGDIISFTYEKVCVVRDVGEMVHGVTILDIYPNSMKEAM